MKYFIIINLLLISTCLAEVAIPVPLSDPKMISGTSATFPESPEKTQKQEILDEYKDLVWHKLDTENFIILSIDKNQGFYIKNNIENIKSLIITRWGLADIKFSSQCKIICVKDRNLLFKLFKIENIHYEIRKNDEDKISLCAIWMCYDDIDKINQGLSDICFSEMEQYKNKKIPVHIKKGMCYLNKDLDVIKNELKELPEQEIKYEQITSNKIEENNKNPDYEKQCAILSLLLRKEFGQNNFINYLSDNDLSKNFGINDNKIINKILNRYYKNLIGDLKQNKVPNDYLDIRRK